MNFKIITPYLQKEDAPAKKRMPVYSFLKRTMNGETIQKDKIKAWTTSIVHDYFLRTEVTKIRMLTMPGVTWDFERDLRKRLAMFRPQRIKLIITGCEIDYKVFRLSAAKMPGAHRGMTKPYYSENLKKYVVTNTKEQTYLIHTDIYEHICAPSNKENVKYDLIWLDTTSMVTTVVNKIDKLGGIISDHAVVILTVLKGREHIKFETDRIYFASEAMAEHKLVLYKSFEYFDTSPMLHLIYTKKILHDRICNQYGL